VNGRLVNVSGLAGAANVETATLASVPDQEPPPSKALLGTWAVSPLMATVLFPLSEVTAAGLADQVKSR